METCKDCLHYEACKNIYEIVFGDNKKYTFTGKCYLFKNKADFVEVVRCKDCKYWVEEKDFGMFCSHWGSTLTESQADDFCSYGERSDTNG
jgi:hypothetical protein